MVRTSHRGIRRRALMAIVIIFTVLIFVYLAYALVNPEKF
ncbi:potassium-transporting ATPase subunit F [Paenibacillus sp. S3N08]|uniref:Potassium-transporting ATPase subunit F n=1 Tax=Paenibacillus agricola TaxID=2716264 RepID=A0ABX0JH68_9BACL|nr:potassium-transporting ATPase subunit F [Paenibacillus agricola]